MALAPLLPACSEGEAHSGWVFEERNPVLGGALGVCFDPCPLLWAPDMTNPTAWDRDAIYKPSAVLEHDGWTLFFNARRSLVEQIGMARHAGRDLGF